MERIEAELLIPGGGEPVSDGVVIIDGPVISYAGPASQAPATPAAVVHRTGTVMLANGAELAHLVRHGMTPLQAIDAATVTAPLTLGPQAPRSGRLEPGYDADVITIDANPLADITVLSHPEHITSVWAKGRRVKG